MNPYFEQTAHWQDFHTEFLVALRRQLAPTITPDYIARLDEHISIRRLVPDQRRSLGPVQDTERIPFLEIRNQRGRELVTVIELLSPSNKRTGEDRESYLTKRRELLRSSAHLVEIDLLRGWTPMPADNRPASDYSVLVSLAEKRPDAAFWPIGLRDPLPEVTIPLRSPNDDARVNLQDVLHQAYDGPGYEHFIYAGDPEPLLSADDAEWARRFVPRMVGGV
jgi:hypothetical protein